MKTNPSKPEPRKLDVKHCSGCVDDFYNGNNPYGIKECWMRKSAKLKPFRLIPINLPPPYLHVEIKRLPTCYRKARHVTVSLDALNEKGFWKP